VQVFSSPYISDLLHSFFIGPGTESNRMSEALKGHTILLLIQSIKQPNHSSVQIRFAAAKKEAADL